MPAVPSQYVIHLGVMILFFAYLGVAWNILGGYAGQFSFGHAAFFGLGAYTSTLLYVHYGVSPWLGMVAAGLAGVALALISGSLSFRYGLRGPYFALVMLAFAEMLRLLFESWMSRSYPLGMAIPPKGTSLVDFQFKDKQWTRGKGFDTFAPTGPCITTRDQLPDPSNLQIHTWVNDELAKTAPHKTCSSTYPK